MQMHNRALRIETQIMSQNPKSKKESRTVRCKVAKDGTGDLIVPLPKDLLREMNLSIGDTLNAEKQADGTITLTKTSKKS